ncbi:hypothetical protein NSP_33560 [Nodularia spumigena CCY9414]|nr:hypothetical protein NSP_33560 [Nodularia spumigena CCY9414]
MGESIVLSWVVTKPPKSKAPSRLEERFEFAEKLLSMSQSINR